MIIIKNKSLANILDIVRDHKGTVTEKAQLLKAYSRKDLIWLVKRVYCEEPLNIEIPEFKYSNKPYGVSFSTILTSLPRIEAAIKYKDNQHLCRKNLLLVLENIPNDEADLLCRVLQGKKIEGVSKAVFKLAFGQYFPDMETETE